MGQPEVKLGPDSGLWRIAAAAAPGGPRARARTAARGRAVTAAEAHRIGLVNAVVPQAELLNYSRAWLARCWRMRRWPWRWRWKRWTRGLDAGLEEGLRLEAAAFGLCAATEDCREGTRAFLEKRKPAFAGK
jgi:enoyl-CoA hydratase